MKLLAFSALAVAVTYGCAAPSHVDPSSSHPDVGRGNVRPEGLLLVTQPRAAERTPKGQGEHEIAPEGFFSVYSEDGRRVATSDTGEISLAPGRYLVQAESGTLFWVTIESGKTTEVDASRVEGHGGAPAVK